MRLPSRTAIFFVMGDHPQLLDRFTPFFPARSASRFYLWTTSFARIGPMNHFGLAFQQRGDRGKKMK